MSAPTGTINWRRYPQETPPSGEEYLAFVRFPWRKVGEFVRPSHYRVLALVYEDGAWLMKGGKVGAKHVKFWAPINDPRDLGVTDNPAGF